MWLWFDEYATDDEPKVNDEKPMNKRNHVNELTSEVKNHKWDYEPWMRLWTLNEAMNGDPVDYQTITK